MLFFCVKLYIVTFGTLPLNKISYTIGEHFNITGNNYSYRETFAK